MKNHRSTKLLVVDTDKQILQSFELQDVQPLVLNSNKVCIPQGLSKPIATYPVSTAKNGLGEQSGSECTPRGWHVIHSIIGMDLPINSVLVGRQWTKEIYSEALATEWPKRDWILTRIFQLDGLEEGRNKGGEVDSLGRYIYIHGTPDSTLLGQPGSHGCIRMKNNDIITLAYWVTTNTLVYIK